MKFKILSILFSIFFLFSFALVSAAGIGVSPSSLILKLEVGESKETKILVYNISQEAGIFQVFPEQFNDWIKIIPDNFRLEAGEKKEVEIRVSAKGKGTKTTNISILFAPLDRSSFGINSGIKIPLNLTVNGREPLFLASISWVLNQNLFRIGFGILAICLIGIFLLIYLEKKKTMKKQKYE